MAENPRRLAVLIDGDNIHVKPAVIPRIMAAIRKQGEPIITRVYGDFSQAHLNSWRPIAAKHHIEMRHSFHASSGKNATDIALVIDAMDILHEGTIDGVCIVSSDRDFTHLARRIRQQGMLVLGIGRDNPTLVTAYNAFIPLEKLTPLSKPVPPPNVEPAKPPILSLSEIEMFRQAYNQTISLKQPPDGWALLTQVRQSLNKLYPDYNPLMYKGAAYPQLKKVIALMQKDYPDQIEVDFDTPAKIQLRMKDNIPS